MWTIVFPSSFPHVLAVLSIAVLGAGLPCATASAEQAKRTWSGNGLRLELAPLLPDQVRAFFIGRGFSAADAERYEALLQK